MKGNTAIYIIGGIVVLGIAYFVYQSSAAASAAATKTAAANAAAALANQNAANANLAATNSDNSPLGILSGIADNTDFSNLFGS